MTHSFSPRSIGVKLFVVCALAIGMTIPAFFVAGLVEERARRAEDVVREVSATVGGRQTFLGPTLVVPYKSSPSHHLFFPSVASAKLKTATEERRRSLFKVPVFRADLSFDASFDLPTIPASADLDWDRAEFLVGVSDPRGALEDAILTAGGNTTPLGPAQSLPSLTTPSGDQANRLKLFLLGAPAGVIAKPGAHFQVACAMKFSGAQRVAVLAYGKKTQVAAQGDWPNPAFDGGFLPVSRSVTATGHAAEWSIPFIARGVRSDGSLPDAINGLDATALGTSFVELADPYQSVNRCLKYVLLLLGLVFLSYFVLEVWTGKRIHPAQYILVGVAQLIFYLLLLSLAERTGFDSAFLAAGGATVGLLAANAAWVFASRVQGIRALATFSLLYSAIYSMLRAEDYALLIGAFFSFLAVAATMYLTRRIDWYSPAETPSDVA